MSEATQRRVEWELAPISEATQRGVEWELAFENPNQENATVSIPFPHRDPEVTARIQRTFFTLPSFLFPGCSGSLLCAGFL